MLPSKITLLRKLRKDMGLSLCRVAREVGIAKSALSRIERRIGHGAAPGTAFRLSSYYGVKMEMLFTPGNNGRKANGLCYFARRY